MLCDQVLPRAQKQVATYDKELNEPAKEDDNVVVNKAAKSKNKKPNHQVSISSKRGHQKDIN